MFQKALNTYGVDTITLSTEDQKELDEMIRDVVGGNHTEHEQKTLTMLANKLKDSGAEEILLGCTELPLVFPRNYSLPVVNSVDELARTLLKETMI